MTSGGEAKAPISTTAELTAFCERVRRSEFVTVDTEFMRETTYWPRLCLIQIAGDDAAATVDPLAPGIDLAPFFRLMDDPSVLKVFHAARQDIEIMVHLNGTVPHPLFDSQIAAMVCGFGDQISYDQLVGRLTGGEIDKTSQFTDWSRRPLSPRQLTYALADVTHLRAVYQRLKEMLEKSGRSHWLGEEMAVLTDAATYNTNPDDAWQRLRARLRKPAQVLTLRRLAAWREREAQTRDVPRSRVIRDDALIEVATQMPADRTALAALRTVPRGWERTPEATAVIEIVAAARSADPASLPPVESFRPPSATASATVDLLKVLLKLAAERDGVAARVIATAEQLEAIALDDNADVPALAGWRRELFGGDALRLKRGEIALTIGRKGIETVERGAS